MRSVFAISAAIALFTTSAFASKNADFNPVNFAAEPIATPEEALENERFSNSIFVIPEGPHITTTKADSSYEAGTAAIRLADHRVINLHKKKGDDDDDDKDDKDDDKDEKDCDDEEEDDKDDNKHGKWNKGDNDKHGKWGKGEHHYPGHDLDLSHTITLTKTKWVIEKSTQVPPVDITLPVTVDVYGKHNKHGKKGDW